MLRRILDMFGTATPKERRFVPSSPDLPELWPDSGTGANLDVLDTASTTTLTQLCDDYWNSFLDDGDSVVRDSRVQRRAMEIIATRGTEAVSWARQRLAHDGYDAREDCASLIAELAENDELGNEKAAIARDLVTLAVTPPKDDTKEAQAAGVALRALSVIGGTECMAAVRQVLTSPDWDDDENQWECADILATMTSEPFMDAEDAVAEAKAWLNANPQTEA